MHNLSLKIFRPFPSGLYQYSMLISNTEIDASRTAAFVIIVVDPRCQLPPFTSAARLS